jgi:hypothetical protein
MVETTFSDSYIPTDTALEALIGADKRASAIALKAASASDQAWYCQEATRHIDSLHLRGQRHELEYIENGSQKDINQDGLTQILEFPRVIDGYVIDWDHGTNKPIVPAQVKLACLEEAIWILQHGDDQRLDNQQTGVASQSIAGASESYVTGFGLQILLSPRARQIMRRYTGAEVR